MKIKNIIIILLSLSVVLLGGFVIYDKFIADSNNEVDNIEEPKVEEKIEKDYDLSAAEELVDKYNFGISGRTVFDGISESDKVLIAFNNVEASKKSYADCIKLYKDNPEAAPFTEDGSDYEIKLDGIDFLCGDNSKTVSYSDLNEVYKRLFGVDLVKKASMNINNYPLSSFDYHKEEDIFVSSAFYGGTMVGPEAYKVKSAKITNDNLIIDVAYEELLYSEYYPNGFLNLNGKEVEFKGDSMKPFFDQYLNEFDTYRFTFKKVDNNYVLDSFVQVLK